jgi:ABC-type ATPase with predicted acetyltransferase domain
LPSFNIVKEIEPVDSFRVSSVKSAFDLKVERVKEQFKGNIDIEGKDWNVGLIVGGSGTGKTTIAKEVFGEEYITDFEYSGGSIIDEMPKSKSVKEVEKQFTSVGFASPPSWLKPYHVLSNGEKMRADLARALLEEKEMVVFDEFTSVVDRDVAKTGSFAVSKAVRKAGKKFIAVACHKDIIDWLEPDWIYDTDQKKFFFTQNRKDQNDPKSNSTYIELITLLKGKFGTYSKSTII